MNYLVKLGLEAAARHVGMHVGNAAGILAARKLWAAYPPIVEDSTEDEQDEPGDDDGDEPGDDEGDGALGRELHLHDLAGRAAGAAKWFARRAVVVGSQVVHRVTTR